MKNSAKITFWIVAGLCFGWPGAQCAHDKIIAHAHNDYEHARPLHDALDNGFRSVEADVFLVDGKLLVAHDAKDLNPERTLEALYLAPLKKWVEGEGARALAGGKDFYLFIDIKSGGAETYLAIDKALQGYRSIVRQFPSAESRPITVVISGNRPKELMLNPKTRLAVFDGRLPDLEGNDSTDFIPIISDNWTKNFKWNGTGPFPADEKQKLQAMVERCHQQKRKLRLWATPDNPAVWAALSAAGVDFINTDDLPGLRKFLTGT
jgi:glycerophosphoryl diester phosphodiesterase